MDTCGWEYLSKSLGIVGTLRSSDPVDSFVELYANSHEVLRLVGGDVRWGRGMVEPNCGRSLERAAVPAMSSQLHVHICSKRNSQVFNRREMSAFIGSGRGLAALNGRLSGHIMPKEVSCLTSRPPHPRDSASKSPLTSQQTKHRADT